MKTVIFGGTFNPIHFGHLQIIESVSALADTEKVVVMPASLPPHKVCTDLANDADRYEMCRLATSGMEKVIVSDFELLRGGKSYTYETLKKLREMYPETDFALVCGGDMIVTFEEWYRYKDILNLAEIYAVRRVGIDQSEFDAAVRNLLNAGGRVKVLKNTVPGISSTEIRSLINKKPALKKYLPTTVIDYIRENKLYI